MVCSQLRRLVVGASFVLLVFVSVARASGDVNMVTCGNAAFTGFSALLPDCRNYEQVSSPFKDGNKAVTIAVSVSGSQILAQSLGAFAGTTTDQRVEGGIYLLTRSSAGWVSSAIAPPVSSFPASELIAASPELGGSLWVARTASQSMYAEDLYLKQAAGGMVRIGPALPPAATLGSPAGEATGFIYKRYIDFGGASDGLSHIVFSLLTSAPLWPGDTTSLEKPTDASLYEYAGLGLTAPELVGVSDGGVEEEGKGLAAGALISDCETDLGSENRADTYNAVSVNGGTVFFTAVGHSNTGGICPGGVRAPGVSEVFARVDGFRTVAISEPRGEQCGVCETSVRAPALFAGASEDGLQAFFLTEQELLSEAKTMNLYEYDFNAPSGKKIVRVSSGSTEPEVQGVARVSEDGSHVYFVAKGVLAGTNGEGEEPVAGGDNLYVYERDAAFPSARVAFVATLSPEDAQDWSEVDNRPVQATSDGRFLVFQSVADLTADDKSSVGQVFEYDAEKEELVRVSKGQAGYVAGEEAAEASASLIDSQSFDELMESPASRASNVVVSGDGGLVGFVSAGGLTEGSRVAGEAGAQSVFEYRSSAGEAGGSVKAGEVYLVSDGRDVALSEVNGVLGAKLNGLDVSGTDVFFESSDGLVSSDGDSQYDVFDARVGGGFPVPVVPAGCEGEGCYGAVSAPSLLGALQGASVAAAGSLAGAPPFGASAGKAAVPRRHPAVGCVRRGGRVRGRCVRVARRARLRRASFGRRGV